MGFLDEKYINLVIDAVNKARENADDYKEQYVNKQQEYNKVSKKMRNKFDLPDTEEVKKSKFCSIRPLTTVLIMSCRTKVHHGSLTRHNVHIRELRVLQGHTGRW